MFLKRIFKRPPPQKPVLDKLDLDALRERVNKLRKEKLETVKPTLNAVLEETAKVRGILLNDLKKLAEAKPSEEVHPGLLKTCAEAKKLLTEKMTRALADIERSTELTTGALEAFDGKLTKAINLTTDATAIHGRYVGTIFGPEFAAVRSSLRRLNEPVEQAHTTIEGILSERRTLDSISSEINSHVELIQYVKKTQDDIKSLEGLSKEIEERVKNEREQLKQLKSSEEFERAVETMRELKQTELEINHVKGEIMSAFSDISRPLRKLEKLVSSGGHQMDREKIKTLDLCISNPLEIISSDEKIQVAEKLLQETAKLLEDGKIKLNEKERRKKLERIRKLAARLKEFKRYLELLNQRLEVQRQALEHPIQKQISKLEQSVTQHESELNNIKKSIEDLDQKTKLTEKEIEEKRANLEKLAGEIIGAKVELTF
jgi:hypothetical protein